MKRWIPILLLALLLSGCGGDVPETTTLPPETTLVPDATAPLVEGLLDPDAALTRMSGGAVQVYALEEEDYAGILPAWDGVLVLRNDYFGDTNLALITAEQGVVAARRDTNTTLPYEKGCLRVAEDGIIYFDRDSKTLVRLDKTLQEISRVLLPAEMTGAPLISEDGTQVYYHTGTQIRVLEVKTGISRLLRDQGENIASLEGLYCGGSVLRVYVDDDDRNMATQYISTENGETLRYGGDTVTLDTHGDMFYAAVGGGSGEELLFGGLDGEVKLLEPAGERLWTIFLPAMGGAVNCTLGETEQTLDYYDLTSGKRTAGLTLPGSGNAWSLVEDETGGIWFLYADGETGGEVLCRWDVTKSALSDSRVYTGRRYTAESPDLEGIEACREKAAEISQTYGVEIALWEDALAVQPDDYTFTPEHRVSAMEQALEVLEKALARYPEGFLETAATRAESGKIRICLVGGIHGSPEKGTLDSVEGVQYWVEGDPYIALVLTGNEEMNFYHEMCHVIETRVLGKTVLYDDWEKLNPKGFKYDYDYIRNLERTDTKYLEGDSRAFVDTYSMSYPKEDRARIMEYAMMEGNEEIFASRTMQNKLLRLCRGIRKAFGLNKYGEVLPWEVYLEQSLVP